MIEGKIDNVTDFIAGKDREERVAKVLSNKTELTRATYNLYHLEVNAMIHAGDQTIGRKNGSSTVHSEQSDALTKVRRQAFRKALTKLQTLPGVAGDGGIYRKLITITLSFSRMTRKTWYLTQLTIFV